jgi:hypothetical protein
MEAEMIGLPIGLISTRVASSCRDASRIQLSRATQCLEEPKSSTERQIFDIPTEVFQSVVSDFGMRLRKQSAQRDRISNTLSYKWLKLLI